MPKPDTQANYRSIRRVAIDGHFLDDVQTRLHSDASSPSLRYLSAPVERHHANEDAEGVTLILPALTALQLHHDGVLSADPGKSVQLTIAGRALGAYFLQWMRSLPGDEFGSPVLLRFGRQSSVNPRITTRAGSHHHRTAEKEAGSPASRSKRGQSAGIENNDHRRGPCSCGYAKVQALTNCVSIAASRCNESPNPTAYLRMNVATISLRE